MGAATALMFAANPGQHKVLLTIADSSYYNFRELLEEIGNCTMGIPMFVIKPLMFMFENRIANIAGFKLSDIHMENYVRNLHSPVIFVAAKCDSVVPIKHSERLYREYRGTMKELFYIERDHQYER
jgi:esterase/lipase